MLGVRCRGGRFVQRPRADLPIWDLRARFYGRLGILLEQKEILSMNEKKTAETKVAKVDSLATKVGEWIASEAGNRALSEALEQAKQATSLLERDCQVKRESLYEPVTV